MALVAAGLLFLVCAELAYLHHKNAVLSLEHVWKICELICSVLMVLAKGL